MNKYSVSQSSGIFSGAATVLQASVIMSGLLSAPYNHADLYKTTAPAYRINEASKTFSQLANLFTGEFASAPADFELAVSSFYSDLLSEQEPLGEEFEKVLYDNLWNLYVRA